MTVQDFIAALPGLPDDAQLTISVRKKDLVHALQERAGGPEVLTTKQAAARYGYTADSWRRWAEGGAVEGAYQHVAKGPWYLPRPSVEAHLASLARGRAPRPTDPSDGTGSSSPRPSVHPRRSRARGPRKAHQEERHEQHRSGSAAQPHVGRRGGAVIPFAGPTAAQTA